MLPQSLVYEIFPDSCPTVLNMTWPSTPRLPLDRELLVRLLESCLPAAAIHVVESTGSTNTDLVNQAKSDRAALLVAEEQSAGRGRLDRTWIAPKRSGLLFSLYWPAPLLMAPLLMGVAAADALRATTTIPVSLKWPNDLMVSDRKLGGILASSSGAGVVIGVGINVSLTDDEKPDDRATSIVMERDQAPPREVLLAEIVQRFSELTLIDGAGFLERYKTLSSTIGSRVRAEMVKGESIVGRAVGINSSGALLINNDAGEHVLTAGDVFHLR